MLSLKYFISLEYYLRWSFFYIFFSGTNIYVKQHSIIIKTTILMKKKTYQQDIITKAKIRQQFLLFYLEISYHNSFNYAYKIPRLQLHSVY